MKKKLIYSCCMVALPAILLIALTLGWFSGLRTAEVDSLNLLVSGTSVRLYRSWDAATGQPVRDPENSEDYIFAPVENPTVVKQFYPGCEVRFRAEVQGKAGGVIHGILSGISAISAQTLPDIDYAQYELTGSEPQPIDAADALRVAYRDPTDGSPLDMPLSEFFDEAGERVFIFFTAYVMESDDTFVFEYSIYMPDTTSSAYQNRQITINAAFTQDQG